jgi:hypothetical protein
MDSTEVSQFLRRCNSMSVGLIDADGELDVAVATCRFVDDAVRLVFDAEDPILPAIEAGATICAQADETPSYYEIKGVVLRGLAVGLGGHEYRLQVDRTVSFDFGKIPNRME